MYLCKLRNLIVMSNKLPNKSHGGGAVQVKKNSSVCFTFLFFFLFFLSLFITNFLVGFIISSQIRLWCVPDELKSLFMSSQLEFLSGTLTALRFQTLSCLTE